MTPFEETFVFQGWGLIFGGLFYSSQAAWPRPLPDEQLGAGARGLLQLPELHLAPSMNPPCMPGRFGLGCSVLSLKKLIRKMQAGQWSWSTGRAETRGGCSRTGSRSCCSPECCREAGKGTYQPLLCTKAQPVRQLSCSQDTSCVPDLHCCKADMLRGWIMVIQSLRRR